MPHSVMAATALPREGGATRERPRHCFLCLPHGATLGLRGGPPSRAAALSAMNVTAPHPDFAAFGWGVIPSMSLLRCQKAIRQSRRRSWIGSADLFRRSAALDSKNRHTRRCSRESRQVLFLLRARRLIFGLATCFL